VRSDSKHAASVDDCYVQNVVTYAVVLPLSQRRTARTSRLWLRTLSVVVDGLVHVKQSLCRSPGKADVCRYFVEFGLDADFLLILVHVWVTISYNLHRV